MQTLLPILLALVTFFGFGPGYAATLAEVKFCDKALTGDVAPTLGGFNKVDAEPSVTVVSKQLNANGELEYILKRTGKHWRSTYRPEGAENAPQGDPRAIISILGAEVARFLGIQLVGNDKMIVPDTEVLNKKIQLLNDRLEKEGFKPIPVRFYTTGDALETDQDYNRKFAESGAFPISADLELYVHDLSYHLASIAFPTAFVRDAIKVAAVQGQFLKYILSQAESGTAKEQTIKKYSYRALHEEQTRLTDFMFGNLAAAFGQKMQNGEVYEGLDEHILDIIDGYFSPDSQRDMNTVLRLRTANMFEEVVFYTENPEDYIADKEFFNLINRVQDDFKKLHPEIDWEYNFPRHGPGDLYRQIYKRIAELKEAVSG